MDANQVVAYFDCVNRIAEGLGVELEEDGPGEVREPRSYGLRDRYLAEGPTADRSC